MVVMASVKSNFLRRINFVELLEPWFANVHGIISSSHTMGVVIVWYLIWLHLVFLITAAIVSENAWSSMSEQNLEERFLLESLVTAWHTIWWNDVDPDDVVGDLDAATLNSWPHNGRAK